MKTPQLLALPLAMLSCFGAQAADKYFCACDTGASGACVVGNDANAGTNASPKQSVSAAIAAFNAGVAGDRILLCKGGAWDNWTGLALHPQNSSLAAYAASPLTVDSYASSNFTSSAKPWLHVPSGTAFDIGSQAIAFEFRPSFGMGSTRFGGYKIRNLRITGTWAANSGTDTFNSALSLFKTASYITFENNTVENLQGWAGCQSDSVDQPSNYINRSNDYHYAAGNGLNSWGCNNVLIEGNTLDFAANRVTDTNGKVRDHAMYVSGFDGTSATTDGINNVIRYNTITNTGYNVNDIVGAAAKCATTILVGHDRIRGWTIEGNTLLQAAGTTDGHCYGIGIGPGNGGGEVEYEKQVAIRGNRIINPGNIGIDLSSCATCTIENNVVVQENNWAGWNGIRVGQPAVPVPPAGTNSKVAVRNNSVYQYGSTDVSTGISVGGSGTGHIVTNNLIHFGAGSATAKYCFAADLAASAYTWDNNLCSNFTGWTATYSTKAAFSSARSGADTNGVSANPVLVAVPSTGNSYSMQIQTSSPAKNAGHATLKARNSIYGYPAVGTRDIGAWEFGSTP